MRCGLAVAAGLLSAYANVAHAADDPVTFRGSFSWLTSVRHAEASDSVVNPENGVLRIPSNTAATELRPNLKFTSGAFQLIVRPRVTASATDAVVQDEREEPRGETTDQVSEAYFQWTVSESVTFAYGRQSYQWGAAESLSPSNRIFHEVAQTKNVLYDVKGRDMARVNLTAGKNFSTIVMAELQRNDDLSPFIAGEDADDAEFQSIGLLKPEVSWNNGADYFGVVVGAREGERGWVGEYFNFSLPIPEGLSFYGDASHERGSGAFRPSQTDASGPAGPTKVVSFEQSLKQEEPVKTLAAFGLRYDFQGGTVLRGEYILNESAWDESEREMALRAFDRANPSQLPLLEQNTSRFLAPGLDVPGQEFAFMSLTAPDVFSLKDLTLYLRSTRSLTDGSSEGYLSLEYKVGDAGTVLFAASGTAGDDDSELRGYAKSSEILAYRHDW